MVLALPGSGHGPAADSHGPRFLASQSLRIQVNRRKSAIWISDGIDTGRMAEPTLADTRAPCGIGRNVEDNVVWMVRKSTVYDGDRA